MFFFGVSAYGAFSCGGKVTFIGIGADGSLDVGLDGLPLNVVCNTRSQGTWAFDVQTCKSVYATILAAKAMDKSLTIYYSDNSYTCSNIPPWSAMPSAYFIVGPY